MKKSLLPFLISLLLCNIFLPFGSIAQKNPKHFVDSLLTQLNQPHSDTEKLSILISLINAYNDLDGEKGLLYEKEALSLATKLNDKDGEAEVRNVIGRIYWRAGNFEKAFEYHDEARKIFTSLNDNSKLASTLRNLGQDYLIAKRYNDALASFDSALTIFRELEDFDNQGFIYNLLAYTYADMGKYGEASKYCYLGLELYEKLNDRLGMAHMIAGIAENSLFMGDYEDALEKLSGSTQIFIEYDDWINVGANYNLMGTVCRLMKNYPEAINNHEKAMDYGVQSKNLQMIGTGNEGIGDVLIAQRKFAEAIKYFLLAESYYLKWTNIGSLTRTYRKLANAHRHVGNYSEAKKYLGIAFERSLEFKDNKALTESYQEAALLDSTLGNWNDAYKNYQQYILHRDSIFNQETTEQIVLLQNQYEFDKKQAAEHAEQERINTENRMQLIFLLIIIALVLALVFVQYKNQQALAKINKDLKNKSTSLEQEMQEKSSILHVVSHDLKSPLNKISGLVNLVEMTSEQTNEQQELITHIRTAIDQGNHLIKNLLDAERMTIGNGNLMEVETNLKEFLTTYQVSMNARLQIKKQKLEMETKLSDSIFKIDKQLLTQVLDNLISNASKFSEMETDIYLKAWQEQQFLFFSVRDEGPGISSEDQKKLFRKFQMLTARPTNGEPSSGLGLSIVKTIIENMGGIIRVTSELGKGTTFTIQIPGLVSNS